MGRALEDGSLNALAVSRSRDGGVTWETPILVRQDADPMLNDKETIAADPTDARYVYVIWDRVDLTTEAEGPTWFARTADGGDTWEPARIIYNPGAVRSTLNNQIVVLPDGTLINFFTEFDNSPAAAQPRLRLLRSADKGVTWSAPVDVATVMSAGTRDPTPGRCIRDGTNLGQITVDRQGRLFVVWQDARRTATRDAVLISRSTDGGLAWSAPAQVSPDLGTQAFTPAIAVARDGTIGVTYYDLRNNTADPATLPTDYWLARSTDGVHWSETHVDGPFDLAIAPNANGIFLGDYQGLATMGNTFVPFYARTNTGNTSNRTDIVAAFFP
ncbi:MAG: exo-alpha-sialidase [Betaproteobacteria bacterium]|nr:exo-alpha-sialidase [Betaproteobacteria bacterium]